MIEIAAAVTEELVDALARLLPQLSSAAAPDGAQLRRIVEGEATTLFLARDDGGRIVGALTLAVFAIPSGTRAWIDDVVVDASARGHGVGEALTRAALERARAGGARTVELTSRPSREAANRLYRRLGFRERETTVYRYELR